MHRSKAYLFKPLLVVCLFVLTGALHEAEARNHIHDVLAKGSQWTLNVDGEEATLTLLGGKGRQLLNGGFEVSYEIDFGGRKGTLEGVSDAKNVSQWVSIELTLKDGVKVTCHGFVAQETDDLMAGTCGDKVAPGAWYATRRTSAPPAQPFSKQRDLVIKKQEQKLGHDLQLALRQRDQAQDKLLDKINELNRCQKLQTQPQESGKTSLKPFSSFKNQVDGKYTTGKADSVTTLDFPEAPSRDSQAEMWFLHHNGGLLDILELGLGPEITDFKALERNKCNGKPVFCEMAYRQQAIYFMLGGN